MAKISKPVLYLAIVAAGAAIYVLTSPNSPEAHTTTPKALHKNVSANGPYTEADYSSTRFADSVLVSRDAFKPGVARKSNALAVMLAAAGGVPADLAGGDPNWVCTGVSEVNGVREALLENKVTNDGEFVKQGDKWKTAVISQVLEDGLVLVGNDSEPKTVHIQQDNTQTTESDSGDTAPLRPSLTGVIGSGAGQPGGTVQALPAPDSNSQAGNTNAG